MVPPRLLDLDDIAPFGVSERPMDPDTYAFLDHETGKVLVDVGDVTIYENDRVIVWPRNGISSSARQALFATAEDGLRDRASSWEQRTTATGRPYRAATVYLAAHEGHRLALALRAAADEPDGAGWNERDRQHAAVTSIEIGAPDS